MVASRLRMKCNWILPEVLFVVFALSNVKIGGQQFVAYKIYLKNQSSTGKMPRFRVHAINSMLYVSVLLLYVM